MMLRSWRNLGPDGLPRMKILIVSRERAATMPFVRGFVGIDKYPAGVSPLEGEIGIWDGRRVVVSDAVSWLDGGECERDGNA